MTQAFAPQLVALNTAAQVGPWSITVTQGIFGDEAIALLEEANAGNPTVTELDGTDPGLAFALAHVTVQNTSQSPRVINLADFAAVGADGIMRRPPTLEVPQPALQTIVPPGESAEGYVPLLLDASDPATLWYDSTLLGGNWATAAFALGPAAAIPTFPVDDASESDAGDSPDTAVDIGQPVRTGGWEVTIDEWVQGQTLWDLATEADDLRARALGSDFIPWWRGIRVTVTNLSPYPATFPNDAFLITDATGDPWYDVLALTVPAPDIAAEYLPGATRQGWAGFDCYLGYAGTGQEFPEIAYVRVQPNTTADPARFVLINPDALTSQPSDEEATASPEGESAEPLEVAVGDTVITVDEIVNLRDGASTSGEVIEELPIGTELEITGEPIEADGYVWFPVRKVEGNDEGFVVQDYLELP